MTDGDNSKTDSDETSTNSVGGSSQDNPMTPDEFLDLVSDEDEKLEWFLREVRDETKSGQSPAEIADELYYRVEESPTNIEYHVVMAVMFGVLWEKEDADAE